MNAEEICDKELDRPYRWLVGSGNPSRLHEMVGVGWPAAEHLSDTDGPGCSVCSMKLYCRTGGASAEGEEQMSTEQQRTRGGEHEKHGFKRGRNKTAGKGRSTRKKKHTVNNDKLSIQ